MAHHLTLYHYWRSSCSWRVRWALNFKKIPYKSVVVNLLQAKQRDEDFLKLNPTGSVPVLVFGDRVMTESLAIIEWIDEQFPGNSFFPGSAFERQKIRQLCLQIVSGIQPVQNLKVLQFISVDQAERNKFASHWIREGLLSFERTLSSEQLSGSFCFGGQLTAADLCLIPQVYNALRFNVSLHEMPIITSIYERCLKIESCQKASPEQQLDALKG